MDGKVTIPALQAMKREGKKSIGLVAWDYQIARIADRAGFDFISVGDSVGVNLWGRDDVLDVTLDEMLVCCKAVRRGTSRSLVSCDMPYGPAQQGPDAALAAAVRLVKDGGADMIKVDAAAEYPQVVRTLVREGIPVFAQFGLTPQTAGKYGIPYSAQNSPQAQATAQAAAKLVEEAKLLEDAGASLLDFTNSGPVAGAAVVAAVKIPVIGGFGGGPWLDGRMRMAHAAIGYAAACIDSPTESYASVARLTLDALQEYAGDVRAARQIKSGRPLSS
jgi:3-methyl-2-oxobutanoate hydroxymethyltransferase